MSVEVIIEGDNILIVDGTKEQGFPLGILSASSEADDVIIMNRMDPGEVVVRANFADFTSPTGTSADEVRNSLNTQLFLGENRNIDASVVTTVAQNIDIQSSTDFATIWGIGGDYNFLQAPELIRLSGASADDDAAMDGARTVLVRTLDANWGIDEFTLTTNGIGVSGNSPRTAIRVLSAEVTSGGLYGTTNLGDIEIETASGTKLGVILAGKGRTRLGVGSVPRGFSFRMSLLEVRVGTNKSADLELTWREGGDIVAEPFGAFQTHPIVDDFTGSTITVFELGKYFPEHTDIRLQAKLHQGSGTTTVTTITTGRLIKNVS